MNISFEEHIPHMKLHKYFYQIVLIKKKALQKESILYLACEYTVLSTDVWQTAFY